MEAASVSSQGSPMRPINGYSASPQRYAIQPQRQIAPFQSQNQQQQQYIQNQNNSQQYSPAQRMQYQQQNQQMVMQHNGHYLVSIPQPIQSPSKIYAPKRLPYYERKKYTEQRRVIQKPWSRPMAAQHLAAIRIQGAIRLFLYRKHAAEVRLARQEGRQMSYAWLLPPKVRTRLGYVPADQARPAPQGHLSPTQVLRQKFLTSPFNVMTRSEEHCLRDFCAALIQATYKMSLTRRLFKYHRFAMYHIAAIQIQWAWRGFLERKKKKVQKSEDVIAVERIQRAWRGFTNIKIFNYYKDLINFKQKGNPGDLLKSINPAEAGLLDNASRCHIRFRLGGEKFPPLIYYKIFSKGGIVDINAFAPRDYMAIKRAKGKDKIDIKYDKPQDGNAQGWYERIENNGWRPINDKTLTPYDPVEIRTANKTKKFHWDPKIRRQLNAKEKRGRKIVWLRKLYRDAKNAELVQEQGENLGVSAQAALESTKFKKQLEQLYDNPFDEDKFQNMEDGDFENEVNNLIEWCEDLDFEKYQDNWFTLATSAGCETPGDDTHIQVYNAEMGDLTIGLMGDNSQMSDPTAQNSIGMAMMDPVRANKFKEDLFQKSNLEYENKLKEHLYQFEKRDLEVDMDQDQLMQEGTMMQMSNPKNYDEGGDSPAKSLQNNGH